MGISDHVYERTLTGSNALVMPAGVARKCFQIEYPHAADITKLVVMQTDGTPIGFVVNLFNRWASCDAAESSSSSVAGSGAVDMELAKVIPTQEQHIPGAALELFHPDGYSFKNMDGTFTVPIKLIYLELTVDSDAEATVWDVAIGCRQRF